MGTNEEQRRRTTKKEGKQVTPTVKTQSSREGELSYGRPLGGETFAGSRRQSHRRAQVRINQKTCRDKRDDHLGGVHTQFVCGSWGG